MSKKEHRLAAVMFTDIQGFSRMMEEDEAATLKIMDYHNALLQKLIEEHRGSVIKTIGDAFLADFPTAVDATKCAIDIQTKLREDKPVCNGRPLQLRIGVHMGDIYFYENDALGEGINIAARLQSLSRPGRICISGEVYHQVHRKVGLEIESLGRVNLKNITREIEAYEIMFPGGNTAADYDNIPEAPQQKSQTNFKLELKKTDSSNSASAPKEAHPQDDLMQNIDEIKDIVVSMIKNAGRRLPLNKIKEKMHKKSTDFDDVLNKLSEKGILTRLDKNDGSIDFGVGSEKETQLTEKPKKKKSKFGDFGSTIEEGLEAFAENFEEIGEKLEEMFSPSYEQYREKKIKNAEKADMEFKGHLGAFIGVNALLILINFMTGAGYLWFLFPLGGWAIGLFTHHIETKLTHVEKDEVEKYPQLDDDEYKTLKKFQKSRRGFETHVGAVGATSLFLLMVNLITSPGFMWSFIAGGAMAVGAFSHWMAYKVQKNKLLNKIKNFAKKIFPGKKPGKKKTQYTNESARVIEAMELKDSIIDQVEDLGKGASPFGDEDINETLNRYVDNIKQLDYRNNELEGILNTIPMGNLEKDKAQLQKKYDAAESDYLRTEYKQSIQEIERQEKSFKELKDQKEVLGLRLNSSVNSLKQMKLDLARMKSLSGSKDVMSLDTLKNKTEELSHYLEDLRDGYSELE